MRKSRQSLHIAQQQERLFEIRGIFHYKTTIVTISPSVKYRSANVQAEDENDQ